MSPRKRQKAIVSKDISKFIQTKELPNTGIKPGSPELQADSLLTELSGKPSQTKE